ncbi:MAG: hypothetical protein Q9169_007405 [Polycauliona sp. 2 TL-2023]
MTKPQEMLGWVSQPDQRGSLDIIWSCVATLGICVWAMLHLNVSSESDTQVTLFLRRLRWMGLALLAPELIMLFASGQWASARRSTVDMRNLGFEGWTMVHAYYADSGGFQLHTKDTASFPVTAKQLHYLVQKGHMSIPNITRKEIWDKIKADSPNSTSQVSSHCTNIGASKNALYHEFQMTGIHVFTAFG